MPFSRESEAEIHRNVTNFLAFILYWFAVRFRGIPDCISN